MPYTILTKSIDDEEKAEEFASINDAVAYAKAWFLEGYDEPRFDGIRDIITDNADRIDSDLRIKGRFICNLFYEEITLHHRCKTDVTSIG
jgi:hypothetical protein